VTLFTPITAVIVAHRIAASDIIEQVEAVTRIPEIIIPAAAKAYIIKAVAVIALVVTVISAVWITVVTVIIIAIVIIAVAGIAQAHVICATRHRDTRRCQNRNFKKNLFQSLHPCFAKPAAAFT
jgi:hypothetical protein